MSNDDAQNRDWLRQELAGRGYDLGYGGQSRFAREADIHVSIVSRALKGVPVSLDVLRRMGRTLNRSLGDMLILSGMATRDELSIRLSEKPADASRPVTTDDLDALVMHFEQRLDERLADVTATIEAVSRALQARDVNRN